MRDKSSSEVRKVEAEAARLTKRRHRHELRGRQLMEAEEDHQEAVAAVILDSIRSAGLMKLPLSEILEKIAMLGQAVKTQNNIAPMTNSDSEQPASEPGGSQQTEDVDRGRHQVFVKLTRNTSAANRELLEKLGLGWNGKDAGWKGRLGEAVLDALQERFGDRLKILPAPRPSPVGGSDLENTEAAAKAPPLEAPSPIGEVVTEAEGAMVEVTDAAEATPAVQPDAGSEGNPAVVLGAAEGLPGTPLPPRPALPRPLTFARRIPVDE